MDNRNKSLSIPNNNKQSSQVNFIYRKKFRFDRANLDRSFGTKDEFLSIIDENTEEANSV